MILKRIDILNYKNIPEAGLEFSEGVNCLLGMNGMGKSNLLDAIHMLCMARPMTSVPDSSLIRHGEDMLLVKGGFLSDSGAEDLISCGISKGKRKSLKRNGKEYSKLSEHIGRYPVVTVTPDDSRIVNGGGEERRKLMDMVISQARPDYLGALIRYNRGLDSRNKMLRAGVKDALLYESIETAMAESAAIIHATRSEWVAAMAPIVEETYSRLSGHSEHTEICYRSQLNESDLHHVIDSRRAKDHMLGFTSGGTHRDDLEASLNGYPLKALGSQGQLKTFSVALRLAIFSYLKKEKGVTPLLLLDDIFDKLDSRRVANIMNEVSSQADFGQIFITDTNRKHLDDILSEISGERTLISVENGLFSPIKMN